MTHYKMLIIDMIVIVYVNMKILMFVCPKMAEMEEGWDPGDIFVANVFNVQRVQSCSKLYKEFSLF